MSDLTTDPKQHDVIVASASERQSASEPSALATALGGLRRRLLSVRTLSLPLRLLTILVFALITALGVLIVVGPHLQDVQLPVTDTGNMQIPLLMTTAIVATVIFGWMLILTGALHAGWSLRLGALAGYTLLAGFTLAWAIIYSDTALAATTSDSGIATMFWQTFQADAPLVLSPLAGLWAWGAVIGVLQWRASRRTPGAPRDAVGSLWIVTAVVTLIVVVAQHGLLVLAIARRATTEPWDISVLRTESYTIEAALLLFLAPAFAVAGTHFADWGQQAGTLLASTARKVRGPWLLGLLTAAVAAAICARLVFYFTAHFVSPAVGLVLLLALGLFTVLVGWLVLRLLNGLAQIERWPAATQIPTIGITLVLTLVWVVFWLVLVSTAVGLGYVLLGVFLLLCLLLLVTIPALLVGSLVALAQSWQRPGSALGLLGLYVLLALLTLPYMVCHIAGLAPGGELFVAPATLTVLCWLALRRRINTETLDLIQALLVLNVGLQVIDWLRAGFPSVSLNRSGLDTTAGILFILAFLWRLLLSGAQGTNVGSRMLPRTVRLLFYLGYYLLQSAVALFITSVAVFNGQMASQLEGHQVAGNLSWYNPNLYGEVGLQVLGVPLLLTLFVLAVARWRGLQHLVRLQPFDRSSVPYPAYPLYPGAAPGAAPLYVPPFSPGRPHQPTPFDTSYAAGIGSDGANQGHVLYPPFPPGRVDSDPLSVPHAQPSAGETDE